MRLWTYLTWQFLLYNLSYVVESLNSMNNCTCMRTLRLHDHNNAHELDLRSKIDILSTLLTLRFTCSLGIDWPKWDRVVKELFSHLLKPRAIDGRRRCISCLRLLITVIMFCETASCSGLKILASIQTFPSSTIGHYPHDVFHSRDQRYWKWTTSSTPVTESTV